MSLEYKPRVLMAALCLFSPVFLYKAEAGNDTDFLFKSIGIEQGLSAREIFAVEQDDNGYMWFGTEYGLNRYDGYGFKIFTHSSQDPTSISDSKVNALLNDSRGRLWVGTNCGLNILDVASLTFSIPDMPQGRTDFLKNAAIRCLYEDHAGNIWIGSMSGLVMLAPDLDESDYFSLQGFEGTRNHNVIRSIVGDHNGNMWIGTLDGLFFLDVRTKEIKLVDMREVHPMEHENNLILSLLFDERDECILWVGTENGLYRYDTVTGAHQCYIKDNHESSLSNNVIKTILPYGPNRIILGTDHGLNLFDTLLRKSKVYLHDIYNSLTIVNDIVWDILRDNAGNIWCATNNGVSQVLSSSLDFDIHEIDSPSSDGPTPDNRVVDMAFDGEGGKYVSLDDRVFYEDGNGTRRFYDFTNYTAIKVKKLHVDKFGTVWAGTSGSLWYKDKRDDDFHRINNKNLRYVSSISEDSEGNIWVESVDGSCRIHAVRDDESMIKELEYKFFNIDRLNARSVRSSSSFMDSSDRLWFMTNDLCLHLFNKDGEEIRRFGMETDESGLKGSVILSFVEISELYVLTDEGIFRYDSSTEKFVSVPDPYGDDSFLTSLVKDRYGNFWAAAGTKLIWTNMETGSRIFFDISSYMDNMILSDNALHIAPDGMLYIGGRNRYLKFYPKQEYVTRESASLLVTDFKITGRSATFDGKDNQMVLRHDEDDIEIFFSLMDFQSPETVLYAVKLDGVDDKWKLVSGTNRMAYSNLSPGKYTFHVKAAYSKGDWIADTSMSMKVLPPWWLSGRAILFYMIIAGLIIYYLWKSARTSLRLREKLRIERVRRQVQNDLIQYKKRFFTNVSHEFKTPLALVMGPLEKMIDETKDDTEQKQLKIMHTNAERLMRMVNQIMDFSRMELGSIKLHPIDAELVAFVRKIYEMFSLEAANRNISYHFRSGMKSYLTSFDDDKVEKIIYNLISNAFKYTPDGGIIHVRMAQTSFQDAEAVELRVQDNGIGIPEEEREKIFGRFYQGMNTDAMRVGTGIGLSLTKDFVNMMGGHIQAGPGEDGFTEFLVVLPLPENTYPGDEAVQADEREEKVTTLLVVDDNPDMCSFMQLSLEKDYNVIVAHDGEEGLMKVRKRNPDMIISDLMMPVMDGIEFCRRIKSDETTSHIPFIVLTAKDGDEDVYAGLRTGADAYIPKPFNMKLLKLRIENLRDARRKMQEHICRRLKYGDLADELDNNEALTDPFVDKVVRGIRAHISDDALDVAALSDMMKLPRQQLYRKVKALTGLTVVELIRSVRLETAATCLRETSDTISEIMYSVGFTNNSYFSKCFSEQYKSSPSDYRRKFTKA